MAFYVRLNFPIGQLQQGDLLANVPFAYFPLTGASVQLASGKNAVRDLSRDTLDIDYVTAKVEFGWGIVLSQTCDVQANPVTGSARRPILFARVRPIKDLISRFDDSNVKNAIKAVKAMATAGNSPSVLYLPAYTDEQAVLPRSGANLLDIQRLAPDSLNGVLGMVKLRLSDPALQALQERCAYCFGRFGAPDDLYYSSDERLETTRGETK